MATLMFKGTPVHTTGELPKVGTKAPDFKLVDANLNDVSLVNFKGKKKILSIAHSLDTGVCANSAKKFNDSVKGRNDVVVLTITGDLPFAQARFCQAENIHNVQTLSMMRDRNFARDYGVLLLDGPLAGLSARSIVVLDENDKVIYTEELKEITNEPNYDKAMAAVK